MVFKLKSQNVNTQSKLQSILSDIIRPLIDQLRRQTTMLQVNIILLFAGHLQVSLNCNLETWNNEILHTMEIVRVLDYENDLQNFKSRYYLAIFSQFFNAIL